MFYGLSNSTAALSLPSNVSIPEAQVVVNTHEDAQETTRLFQVPPLVVTNKCCTVMCLITIAAIFFLLVYYQNKK